jgi:hypothetical protein
MNLMALHLALQKSYENKNFMLLFGWMLLMTQSCTKDKYAPIGINNDCDTTYYTREIKPIISNNCSISGCHNGEQSTPNYNNFEELKKEIEDKINNEPEILYRIKLPISDPLHMPIDFQLNQSDIDKLESWINSGYAGC